MFHAFDADDPVGLPRTESEAKKKLARGAGSSHADGGHWRKRRLDGIRR